MSAQPWGEYDQEPTEPSPAVDRRYLDLTAQLLDADGLRKLAPPELLVEGYLFKNSLAWLGGKPHSFKSFVAVELACCVATGTAWHGREVAQRRVLYLIAEGASGLSQRVDAWELANGRKADDVMFLPVPVQIMKDIDVAAFALVLKDVQPMLAILDTQARVTVGAEENSSKDMGVFVDALEELRRRSEACILPVHHEPRNGENLRGSIALEGAATSILRVSRDGNQVELTNPKQKDVPEQPPLLLVLKPMGDSAILSHEDVGISEFMAESENRVMITLRDSFGNSGATKTELRDACDLPKTTWYRAINTLVQKGIVLEVPRGRSTIYRLALGQED